MTAIVLLSLPLCLLVIGTLMVLAFVDGAFHLQLASSGATPCGRTAMPHAFPVFELTATGERLSSEVLAVAGVDLKCPPTPFIPQVTEPEAKAIAAEIQRRGSLEVGRVLDRTRACSGRCPMRLTSGKCDCSTARPLNCIGRCQSGSDAPEWAEGLGDSLALAFRDHLQAYRVNAETQPLDRALVSLLESPQTAAVISRN